MKNLNLPVEGGDFICYVHDFKTSDVDKWDAHCLSTKHTVSGTAPCADCDTPVSFDSIGYVRVGRTPHVKCKDCSKDG